MVDWIHKISELTSSIDQVIDTIRGQVVAALGIEDPVRILPYRGHGMSDRLLIKTRS
jgi:hypothetical protein